MRNDNHIKRGRNQLQVRLRTKCAGDESVYDLLKIPIDVLYKEALREIGEQESYIDELKDTIKKLNIENAIFKGNLERYMRINSEERMSIKREEMYALQKKKNSKLNAKIKYLKENLSELVLRIVKYEDELKLLRGLLNKEV